ncbi:hypothetical protein O5O45_29815 [Hahella aquimaris]|uniref:hypothetical protein n=1 Tax=Hahella sp. HNIBRBA332 TaxID=3015983 RepID=UPI00273A9D38|nr:hypothetical protein [Hahella sp. HNIBRBA332]WLQ13925.1 hypothetical protein O5O45_29815 [Hahella sp. HNIBRBA332]
MEGINANRAIHVQGARHAEGVNDNKPLPASDLSGSSPLSARAEAPVVGRGLASTDGNGLRSSTGITDEPGRPLRIIESKLERVDSVNSKLDREGIARNLNNPALASDEVLVAAEILSRNNAMPPDHEGHIIGEGRIVERYFGRSAKNAEGVKSPEALIQNVGGAYTAFEVKNQDIAKVHHVVQKFESLFTESHFSSSIDAEDIGKRVQSIGRLDLYVPSGFNGSEKGDISHGYGVNKQGLLTQMIDGEESVLRFGPNRLPVHVIRRDLPPPPPSQKADKS